MNEKYSTELISRADYDQKMRRAETEWDDAVDIDNTNYLRELIDETGWPSISEYGQEVGKATWLLAQHADHDATFQHRCLELMKSMPTSEVDQTYVAFLEDRMRVNNNESQLYGTQFYKDGERYIPHPIDDMQELDDRRLAMGLESFAEYEVGMRRINDK
jgi:hypothetical protein